MSNCVEEDDWAREEEERRRQGETFRRIHMLYKHGFRPRLGGNEPPDAIYWDHLGKYSSIYTFSDGKIAVPLERIDINPEDELDKSRIYNLEKSDVSLFDRWISTVPMPTWWQAGAMARERYIWIPLFITLFYVISGLVSISAWKLLSATWHAV